MHLPYLQKILLWHPLIKMLLQRLRPHSDKTSSSGNPLKTQWRKLNQAYLLRKGGVSLISAFIVCMFSIFGLGLIFLSHIHLKVSAAKRNTTVLAYAAENGIKQGFHHLINLLSEASAPSLLSASDLSRLREKAQREATGFIEEVLDAELPLSDSESWENQSWESNTHFSLERVKDQETYFFTLYSFSINSRGMMENFPQKKEAVLTGSIGIYAGYLPLSVFPFLLDKPMNPEEKKDFIERNSISFYQSQTNRLPQKIHIFEKKLIPEDANTALRKAFKVELFQPQNLSKAQLRFFLGLEVSNDPIPEGVYLIKDNLGLGGVYVEGDVEEMVCAIEEEFQVVFFRMKSGTWRLKYSPLKRKTYFTSPEESTCFDLIPLGIIIVSGKVKSLGGGVVDSSGEVTMVKDEEIPSILKGIHLLIISSDTITISSHLIRQGLTQQKGVPYIKDSSSQLLLFSTGKSFWDDTATEGGIRIDENSPTEIKIQAILTASGKGFAIEGKGKNVHILGSLQASEYISHENRLKIGCDETWFEAQAFPDGAPTTTEPVLFVSSIKISGWEEL